MYEILKAICESPTDFYPEGAEQEFNTVFLVNEKYIIIGERKFTHLTAPGVRMSFSNPPHITITEKGYNFLKQYEQRHLFLLWRWWREITIAIGFIAAIISIIIYIIAFF